MKKPKVEFDSRGPSGNIYAVLCLCSNALRKARCPNAYNELRDKVLASHSYDAALAACREYVELIDKSGEK